MLRELTASQFETLRVFDLLEPDVETRLDFNFAHLIQWFVQLFTRRSQKLGDFVLRYGGESSSGETSKKQGQSLEYQQREIDAWCFVSNEVFKNKIKVVRSR